MAVLGQLGLHPHGPPDHELHLAAVEDELEAGVARAEVLSGVEQPELLKYCPSIGTLARDALAHAKPHELLGGLEVAVVFIGP